MKSFDPLSTYADLSLEKQVAAKKLGHRYYDAYVPRYEAPKGPITQTVIRQSLIPGSCKPNGQQERTKKHISELFFSAGPDLRNLEPVFKSKSTEASEKFFELLQNKRKEDLPSDPKWLLGCSQILGEAWWFGYTFRQQLPILAKVLDLLQHKLKKDDPVIQLLNIVYHNFSDSAKVLAQHDLWIHCAAVALKHTANPKAWTEMENKCMKRRKEYRFNRHDETELLNFYADIVPNPAALEKRLQRDKDAYNRQRRKRFATNSLTDVRNRYRRIDNNRRNDRRNAGNNRRSNNNRNNNKRPNNRNNNRNRNNDTRRDTRNDFRPTNNRNNNNKNQRGPKAITAPPKFQNGKKKIVCHTCGVPGHKSPQCPLRRNKK